MPRRVRFQHGLANDALLLVEVLEVRSLLGGECLRVAGDGDHVRMFRHAPVAPAERPVVPPDRGLPPKEGEGLVGDALGEIVVLEADALEADSRDADPAERGRQVADEKAVDPYRPGADRPSDTLGPLRRRRVNGRREAIPRRVGERDRLVLGTEGLEGQDRSEHFLLDDLRVVRARFDERRLVPEPADLRHAAPPHDAVAVRKRPVDEPLDAREVVAMDERRDRRRLLSGVAEHVGVDSAVKALEKLARGGLLDEETSTRHAVLAGVVVLKGRLLGGRVEVGVGSKVPGSPRDDAAAERALEHGHVEALDRRDPVDVGIDQIGEAAEVLGANGDSESGPVRESRARCLNGKLLLAGASPRDLGEYLLVDRGAILEAGVARHAPPADEMVRRNGDAGDAHTANSIELESTTLLPPSIAITAPVVKPAPSDASHATAAAISSGLPGRRSGTREETSS